MAITTVAPLDLMKRELGKVAASAVNFLTDAQFNAIIISHAVSTSQSYTFQQVATGYYVLRGYKGVSLFTVGTAYTETGGVSSTFTAGWLDDAPVIAVSAGTQSGDTIAVTATPIDVRKLMMSVIGMLEAHARQNADYTIGQFGISRNQMAENLAELRRRYQGPFGV